MEQYKSSLLRLCLREYKLYDYIRDADVKKIKAIYTMLEEDIRGASQWWEDEKYLEDLNQRISDWESGKDKGFTEIDIQQEISRRKVCENA